MRNDVVAIYVDKRGPYTALVSEWYDEARDARTYAGPWPVVAHPPCGAWGQMSHLHKRDDASFGPHAVNMVRTLGGVLEHPANSRLFDACRMPYPGELPDEFGGRTYALQQVSWGHKCRKPTWIYVVGVDPTILVRGIRTGGEPTHQIWGMKNSPHHRQLFGCSSKIRRLTPHDFAEWLVSLASGARPSDPKASASMKTPFATIEAT
jgi:hypothetical protein